MATADPRYRQLKGQYNDLMIYAHHYHTSLLLNPTITGPAYPTRK